MHAALYCDMQTHLLDLWRLCGTHLPQRAADVGIGERHDEHGKDEHQTEHKDLEETLDVTIGPARHAPERRHVHANPL